MAKLCISCGKMIEDNQVFCPYCGANHHMPPASSDPDDGLKTVAANQYQPPVRSDIPPAPVSPAPAQPLNYSPAPSYGGSTAPQPQNTGYPSYPSAPYGVKKRSKAPIFIGIGAGVALVAIVVVILLVSGVFGGNTIVGTYTMYSYTDSSGFTITENQIRDGMGGSEMVIDNDYNGTITFSDQTVTATFDTENMRVTSLGATSDYTFDGTFLSIIDSDGTTMVFKKK